MSWSNTEKLLEKDSKLPSDIACPSFFGVLLHIDKQPGSVFSATVYDMTVHITGASVRNQSSYYINMNIT